jgi:DNA-binding beta-propeller fold protein YncE
MHYFPEGREPESALVWPGPPDAARLSYAGELIGEENFRSVDGAEDGAAVRVLRWIAGIAGANDRSKQLIRPQSGMVDARGRILVTDAGREGIIVFDEVEATLSVWDEAEPGRGFLSPVGIVDDGSDGYLVADADIGYLVRLNGDGSPNGDFGRGILQRPTGLCRDGEFNGPTHMSFADDRLYVTDTLNARIQVLSTTGEPLGTIGQRGLYIGNLVRPKGVVTDRDGHVYVIESYHDHVLVFSETGELLLPIGGTGKDPGRFFLPAGAWTDDGSRLFVADMFNGRVVVFDYLGDTT